MFGAGADVFAVWAYVIANCQDFTIELNPSLLAAIIGSDKAAIESAISSISYLCSPDPDSQNPAEDGRRLMHEAAFQYRVVSHKVYRAIQRGRATQPAPKAMVTRRHAMSHPERDKVGQVVTQRDLSASVSASEE
jgi:hypothetical protein